MSVKNIRVPRVEHVWWGMAVTNLLGLTAFGWEKALDVYLFFCWIGFIMILVGGAIMVIPYAIARLLMFIYSFTPAARFRAILNDYEKSECDLPSDVVE